MQELTERQQAVLDYVSTYLDQNGCPPTLREISDHLGVKGTNTVMQHLDALEKKGRILRRDGSRGISIVGRGGSIAVPIVGKVQAGQLSLAYEDIQGYYNVDLSWVNEQGCFFLRVEGNSMIDAHILDGDLVLIRPQQTADNGQIVVAMVDGEATLKRFFKEKNRIRLQPENKEMEPIIINAGQAETVIVGKLLKTIRNYQ
jgi:repressor LexA